MEFMENRYFMKIRLVSGLIIRNRQKLLQYKKKRLKYKHTMTFVTPIDVFITAKCKYDTFLIHVHAISSLRSL